MKRIKPWSALLLAAALIVSLLTGCSQEQAAGISLSVCVGSEPVTLDPIYAEETADQTILVHLYENLMRVALDATGQNTVTYGIAKSVSQEANYDGTVTYTFKLRSAHWSDGVSVKADDLYMPGSGWPILPASLLTLNFCLSWWDMTRPGPPEI